MVDDMMLATSNAALIPPAFVQSAHHQGTGCLVLMTAYKLTSVGLVNTMPLDDVALNRWSHPVFSDGTELSYRQGIHGILTLEAQITKLETKLQHELEDLDKARLSYTNALKQHRDATAIIALAKDVRKHERVVQRNNVHKAELETQITNVKTNLLLTLNRDKKTLNDRLAKLIQGAGVATGAKQKYYERRKRIFEGSIAAVETKIRHLNKDTK